MDECNFAFMVHMEFYHSKLCHVPQFGGGVIKLMKTTKPSMVICIKISRINVTKLTK